MLIEINNLMKDYHENLNLFKKNKINIFNGLNIAINEGEKIKVTGLNGSGKTTFLKLLSGSINPNIGNIIFHKKIVVSFVSANQRSFYGRLTAIENLKFFCQIDDQEIQLLEKFISDHKELLNLNFLNKKYIELSSGQKKKLGLLRGLYKNPDLLILDEPLTYLDTESRKVLISYINSSFLDSKKTLIFSSNEVDDGIDIDRILNIKNKNIYDQYD